MYRDHTVITVAYEIIMIIDLVNRGEFQLQKGNQSLCWKSMLCTIFHFKLIHTLCMNYTNVLENAQLRTLSGFLTIPMC